MKARVLTLLVPVNGEPETRAKQLIHSLIRLGLAIREEDPDEHTLSCRTERSEEGVNSPRWWAAASITPARSNEPRFCSRPTAACWLSDEDIAAALAVGGSTSLRDQAPLR